MPKARYSKAERQARKARRYNLAWLYLWQILKAHETDDRRQQARLAERAREFVPYAATTWDWDLFYGLWNAARDLVKRYRA